MVGVGFPGPPLLGSKSTKVIPTPVGSSLIGKLSTFFQLAPESPLFHSPFLREPKKRTLVCLGSTASRSPLDRPFSFPPILIGMSVRCQVAPRSLERSMAPLPAQDCVYVPMAA